MISDSLAPFIRPIVTTDPSASSVSAAQKLRQARVGCVVVTRGERIVGILTDRDLALRVVAEGRDATATTVEDVMTADPYVLSSTDTVQAAVRVMQGHGVRRIPIVDEQRAPIGIVTADGLLGELGALIAAVGRAVSEPSDSDESR
jgi:CBS domain-containing protein